MKKTTLLIALNCLMILFMQSSFAQLLPFNATKTSVMSGDFWDPFVWSPPGMPAMTDNVMISSGHTVTLVANTSVKSIAIEPDATFDNADYALQLGIQDFSSMYRNQGTHNSNGGKIICTPIAGGTEFQGNGITNCDIEVPATGPKFTFSSTLTINGNIYNSPDYNQVSPTFFIEVTNGSHININGNLTAKEDADTGIDIYIDASLNVDGSVYLNQGSHIDNRGNLSVSGNLHIGNAVGYIHNDTNANLSIGGDLLGEGNGSFFLQEANAVAAFGGNVFPITNDGVLLAAGLSQLSGQSVEPNTIIYNGLLNQTIKTPSDGHELEVVGLSASYLANTYSNLVLGNTNTKILENNIVINGDLTITEEAEFDTTFESFNIDLKGNWSNSSVMPDAFYEQFNTVTFSGTTPQSITSDTPLGESFYNLIVDNPAGILLLNANAIVSNSLSLLNGTVTTGDNKVTISNPVAGSITDFNQNSFVNGNLRRYISSNSDTYAFPIGFGTNSSNYFRTDLLNDNLTGISYIDAHVNEILETNNNIDANITTTQDSNAIIDVNSNAIWSFIPDAEPTGGSYGTKLYTQNISGLIDNLFFTVKRPSNSLDYADWSTFSQTTTVPNNSSPGRTIASGYAQRTGYTTFSEFAIGTLDPQLKVTSFDATKINVFPNPAKDHLNILLDSEMQDSTIVLYDTLGKKIFEISVKGQNKCAIYRNGWANGVYFLKIKNEKFNITKKVVFE